MDKYWLYVVLAFALSLLSGFVMMPRIVDFCMKRKLYDMPNERKVHHAAIPRLGGVAFIPSMFTAFIISLYVYGYVTDKMPIGISMWTASFVVSMFMIYIVGVVDDVVGLGPNLKFLVQIVAASLLPICDLYINDLYGFCGINSIPFWIGAPLTVLVIVFIDNAINLIDGIDGLAGGLALISLAGFLVCFGREHVWTYCVLIAGLMGVLCAYLYFNVWGSVERHHKIFMGDSGSLTLGFVLGFLVVKFAMNSTTVMPYRSDGLLLAYTLLIVPCFDVVRVIIVRLRVGQPLFKADKRHIHHKLLRLGLTQKKSLAVILSLQLLFVAVNTLLNGLVDITAIVAIDIAAFAAFHYAVDVATRRKKTELSQSTENADGQP